MTSLIRRFDSDNYFSILFERQSYANMLYLLLSFPLGIAYFVLTVTGASLSVGLAIVGVGLVLFLALVMLLRGVASLERQMVTLLLNVPIEPAPLKENDREGIFGRIQTLITDPYTYRTAAYALLKFPLGIASFVLLTTTISTIAGLIAAPIVYPIVPISFGPGVFVIDSLTKALLAAGIGLMAAPLALHLLNLWTQLCAIITRICLGAESTQPLTAQSLGQRQPQQKIAVQDEIIVLKEAEKEALKR